MKNKIKIFVIGIIVTVALAISVYIFNIYRGSNLLVNVGDIKAKTGMTAEDFEDPNVWLSKDSDTIIAAIRESMHEDITSIEMMSFESTDKYAVLQVMADNYSIYNLRYDKLHKKYTVTRE